jgi:hypothetical protein
VVSISLCNAAKRQSVSEMEIRLYCCSDVARYDGMYFRKVENCILETAPPCKLVYLPLRSPTFYSLVPWPRWMRRHRTVG